MFISHTVREIGFISESTVQEIMHGVGLYTWSYCVKCHWRKSLHKGRGWATHVVLVCVMLRKDIWYFDTFVSNMLIYCRDEAEMEYLKIAQELEMYGISYFEIKVSYRRDGYQVADAFWSYKGLSVILTLLLPCFSVQIKHKISKNMNSVQQQCEHHH